MKGWGARQLYGSRYVFFIYWTFLRISLSLSLSLNDSFFFFIFLQKSKIMEITGADIFGGCFPFPKNLQEGWLEKHAISEEDRLAAENSRRNLDAIAEDPMQGLEGLDVAGPKPA